MSLCTTFASCPLLRPFPVLSNQLESVIVCSTQMTQYSCKLWNRRTVSNLSFNIRYHLRPLLPSLLRRLIDIPGLRRSNLKSFIGVVSFQIPSMRKTGRKNVLGKTGIARKFTHLKCHVPIKATTFPSPLFFCTSCLPLCSLVQEQC